VNGGPVLHICSLPDGQRVTATLDFQREEPKDYVSVLGCRDDPHAVSIVWVGTGVIRRRKDDVIKEGRERNATISTGIVFATLALP
jgi:hypothetical protein